MKDNINQILNISKFVMGLVGVSLCVWLVAAKYPESGAPLDIINAFVKDSPWSFSAISYVNFLIGVALITVIGFFIYQLIIRPKQTGLSILGLLVSASVFLVLYLFGSADTVETLQLDPEKVNLGANTIAVTTAGIYTIGICLFIGLNAIIFGSLTGKYAPLNGPLTLGDINSTNVICFLFFKVGIVLYLLKDEESDRKRSIARSTLFGFMINLWIFLILIILFVNN